MNKKSEILAYISEMENTGYSDVQSVALLLEYGFKLSQWVAFSGEAMSEAKKLLHDARRQSYLNVTASMDSQSKKWSPSLVKDYVNDCCAEENAYYELCERCNRAATHCIDLVRTAISALKAEMQTVSFQSSNNY